MGAQIAKKILFNGKLIAQTGIAVGGTDVGLEIGGVDKIIVRHPITKQPYIPGSSIKGKMRSLLEKTHQGNNINRRQGNSRVHLCDPRQVSQPCEICTVFG
ncbi:type III-A CRISPR-associated RAMP protein Csm3, partial [bacterium]|nr:type III-A CRISPR-associated RAMP protein Csm3 [bacterium]